MSFESSRVTENYLLFHPIQKRTGRRISTRHLPHNILFIHRPYFLDYWFGKLALKHLKFRGIHIVLCASCHCDNCHNQKQLGEEWVCFSLPVKVHHPGKPGQELKAETCKKVLKWKNCRNVLTGLLSNSFSPSSPI